LKEEKMSEILDFQNYPINLVLKKLLKDKTTNKNIIWATNTFEHLGREFDDKKEISLDIFNLGFKLSHRVSKSDEEKLTRTKNKAEVFTPSWIVNEMNNYVDEEYFDRKNVFNIENDKSWETNEKIIEFPNKKSWKKYIALTFLEITCGEGPFLASRYDAATGELLEINNRIGILDRKLRIVNENTDTKEEWIKWAIKSVESIYGYEYQGDNLLIARANILMTFVEYYEDRWKEKLDIKILNKVTNIITWNIWQMDGLNDTVPFAATNEIEKQLNVFDILDKDSKEKEEHEDLFCKIRDWRSKETRYFKEYKEKDMKKFDFVIGNPPYQEESKGNNESDTPLYHYFYDAAFELSDKVELITPARFLFKAGYTPKKWNEKMLNDENFKVLYYNPKSEQIFPGKDIKGGIAVTYRDKGKIFGAIGTFTAFDELNSIKRKVELLEEESLSTIVTNRGIYKYSKKAYEEQEEELKKTADARIAPSAFERMPALFTDEKPSDGNEYIKIYGLLNGRRCYKWFRKDYIKDVDNLYKYKVMIPKANGSGAIGEVLSTPLVGLPLVGFTETFISIGEKDSREETEAILKYVKTKFARVMLGILKVTQNNAKPTWKYVPLQDFTENSDIDWSKSIAEIDRQLYKKYNLDEEEINFIETNVKEMK